VSVLALESVSKSFGTRLVLDTFSVEVDEGERVALLGPSGCGKTTALRLLAGFEMPDAGRVIVGGALASADGRMHLPPERRSLGMVFQDLALWPHLTVSGNLEFGLHARGVPKQERDRRTREMLERVELTEHARTKPAALSGGQQQRVALARALVLRPAALLMDEPLSSLDYELNLRLRREILDLQRELGFAFLYVTHDREEAFGLAQRVILMEHGREAIVGTPEEIRAWLARPNNHRRST
jgi:ABC-type Fe3+/spermidine/putrescine transport system ATPase subunit